MLMVYIPPKEPKAAALVLWRILQWPILLESPGYLVLIGTCRTLKKEILLDCWFDEALMKWCADARPGRKAGVIAGL
jgi:hypothetical protein